MKKKSAKQIGDKNEEVKPRIKRVDAQRKMTSVLQSAAEKYDN